MMKKKSATTISTFYKKKLFLFTLRCVISVLGTKNNISSLVMRKLKYRRVVSGKNRDVMILGRCNYTHRDRICKMGTHGGNIIKIASPHLRQS